MAWIKEELAAACDVRSCPLMANKRPVVQLAYIPGHTEKVADMSMGYYCKLAMGYAVSSLIQY
jgi:hypothetical protein